MLKSNARLAVTGYPQAQRFFRIAFKQGTKVPNNITKIADSRRNLDAAYDGLLAFQLLTFNPEEPHLSDTISGSASPLILAQNSDSAVASRTCDTMLQLKR